MKIKLKLKITKQKRAIKIWGIIIPKSKKELRYEKIINSKADLKQTWCLKTAIIDKEWKTSLKNDIFEGPKNRLPLIESIWVKFLIFFLNDAE